MKPQVGMGLQMPYFINNGEKQCLAKQKLSPVTANCLSKTN